MTTKKPAYKAQALPAGKKEIPIVAVPLQWSGHQYELMDGLLTLVAVNKFLHMILENQLLLLENGCCKLLLIIEIGLAS